MLGIIVISDEPLIEAGLRFVFRGDSGVELLSVCETTAQFLALQPKYEPALILCVLRPDTELALGDLRRHSPRSAIILIARDFSPEFAHQALSMGVRGFVRTTAAPGQVIDCLRTVARGELWMEQPLSMRLLDARPVTLSRRQTQLVHLLAQGLKNKEIATALGIAEGTVKAYLTVLFEKLGAKDRFELALFGLKNVSSFGDYSTAQRIQVHSIVPRAPASRTVA